MEDFFHTGTVVLTDELFFQYTPPDFWATGTFAQRLAAYSWSEQMFMRFAGCPILPTVVTGTYAWPDRSEVVPLRYNRVRSLESVTAVSVADCKCTLNRNDGCGIIIDDRLGYVNIKPVETAYYRNCCQGASAPLQMEIAYETGFNTGTIANDTSLHAALAMGATIILNEFNDPAANEGGQGDPGITTESSLGYSQTFKKFRDTPWGHSNKANMITKLIPHLKAPNRPLRMGRRR